MHTTLPTIKTTSLQSDENYGKNAVAETCNLLFKFSKLRRMWQPSFRSNWYCFSPHTHFDSVNIHFYLTNLRLKCSRKKKSSTNSSSVISESKSESKTWGSSQKWKTWPASSKQYEALLEDKTKTLKTASATSIFTSHNDEKANASAPSHLPWQRKTDIHHLLQVSHIIPLLCYYALRTSDSVPSPNPQRSRADSYQCCRIGIKKEKEKPAKRCVKLQPKELY